MAKFCDLYMYFRTGLQIQSALFIPTLQKTYCKIKDNEHVAGVTNPEQQVPALKRALVDITLKI